jgi:hypothetical protein
VEISAPVHAVFHRHSKEMMPALREHLLGAYRGKQITHLRIHLERVGLSEEFRVQDEKELSEAINKFSPLLTAWYWLYSKLSREGSSAMYVGVLRRLRRELGCQVSVHLYDLSCNTGAYASVESSTSALNNYQQALIRPLARVTTPSVAVAALDGVVCDLLKAQATELRERNRLAAHELIGEFKRSEPGTAHLILGGAAHAGLAQAWTGSEVSQTVLTLLPQIYSLLPANTPQPTALSLDGLLSAEAANGGKISKEDRIDVLLELGLRYVIDTKINSDLARTRFGLKNIDAIQGSALFLSHELFKLIEPARRLELYETFCASYAETNDLSSALTRLGRIMKDWLAKNLAEATTPAHLQALARGLGI